MEIDGPTCRACLDLNYNLFQELDEPRNDGRTQVRYQALPLCTLKSSAAKGCRYCNVLYQGVALLWPRIEQEIGICIQRRLEESLVLFRFSIGPNCETWQSTVKDLPAGLEFYTKTGSNPIHPAFGHADIVPRKLGVTTCILLIRGWLRDCDAYHTSCATLMSKLPKRLINISGHFPRLVETKGVAFAKYVTLSHCWGRGKYLMMTTKGNIQRRRTGIRWSTLPRIFQEAITIAKMIGCGWVWIDSLCIIQDDTLDWNEEALKMSDYYSNSFLNIAATSSLDSSGSLFAERGCIGDIYDNWERCPVESVKIANNFNGDHEGVLVRNSLDTGHEGVSWGNVRHFARLRLENAPLLERAWVFQERLLSRRTVHFCSSEMIWECASSVACECSGIKPKSPDKSSRHLERHSLRSNRDIEKPLSLKGLFSTIISQHRVPEQLVLDFWIRSVNQYSTLAITKHSDRPFALAGVAQRISTQIRGKYLAGIWAADLPRALLWRAYGRIRTIKRTSQKIPTWSWMSRYDPRDNSCNATYVNLPNTGFEQDHRLEIHYSRSFCNTIDNDPFGIILSGQLELTAALVSAKVLWEETDYFLIAKGSGFGNFWPDYLAHPSDRFYDGKEFLCMIVGTTKENYVLWDGSTRAVLKLAEYAIVLRPLSNNPGLFERIGQVTFILPLGTRLKGAKTRLVKII